MNEKITLPALSQLLAIATGETRKQSEDFLKEFFNLISSSLADGEQVKIKDLGVFKTVTVDQRKSVNVSTGEEHIIPSHRKVVFVPAKEIASLVNAPFEMFETVELADDFEDIDDLYNDSLEPDVRDDEFDNPLSTANPDNSAEVTSIHYGVDNSELNEFSGNSEISDKIEENISTHDEFEEEYDNIGEDSENIEDVVTVAEPSSVESNELAGVDNNKNSQLEADTSEGSADSYESQNEEDNQIVPAKAALVSEEEDLTAPEIADDTEDVINVKHKSRFGWGFLTGFCVALACIMLAECAVWYFNLIDLSKFRTAVDQQAALSDSIITDSSGIGMVKENDDVRIADDSATLLPDGSERNELASSMEANVGISSAEAGDKEDDVPTEPSDKKIYDTISKTRYLTTMAKQHYGNFHLWPYIYIENQAFLGHPDRIKPGTKVVIPPLSKYGVDPNNPVDIAKAKKKGVEIYSRYK